ncbi:MAG: hypothetical protein ACOH2S_20515 [Janthinobacterium svalbardensis]
MEPSDQLSFSVTDSVDDIPISPKRVPLSLLGEFQKDVSDFLKGSNRDAKPSDVMVSVESGSLALVASGLLAVTALWSDVSHMHSSYSLSLIDDNRAKILEKWQQKARENPNRSYKVSDKISGTSINIDSHSNFHQEKNIWMEVEKYLLGTITDLGGLSKPNIHVVLNDGTTVTVSANKNQLLNEEKNLVYRELLLHVNAEENLISKQLRNIRLIEFENYQPSFDEEEFNRMTERGAVAWADVQDAGLWVDKLRGEH